MEGYQDYNAALEESLDISLTLFIIILLVIFVINIILCCVAASTARNKGRSYAGWFCLGFFLLGGLVTLIIAACISDRNMDYYTPTNTFQSSYSFNNTVDMWVCKKCGQTNRGGSFCACCGKKRK